MRLGVLPSEHCHEQMKRLFGDRFVGRFEGDLLNDARKVQARFPSKPSVADGILMPA